ncbi:MAG: hypothetical protein ABIQ35_06775 [Verrucomicrobiota bacterium]
MYQTIFLSIVVFCAFISTAYSQVSLRPTRASGNPFQFVMSGSSDQVTVIETTTDLQNWLAVQTNAAGAQNVTYTDWWSHDYARRFYRVRTLTSGTITTNPVAVTNPPSGVLADLATLPNSVFMAGEGFNSLQFAPNGKLGFIAWRGQDLIYRERVNNSWSEQVIGRYGSIFTPGIAEEYRFQPHVALLFDSQSRAHILRLSGFSVAHHVQNGGNFSETSAISLNSVGSSFSLFTVAMGPGDKLHIALEGTGGWTPIFYGTDKSGSWQWTQAATIAGNPRGFLKQSYAPRWFSMAIDSGNNAHITFCPEFKMPAIDGHSRPYSDLYYASNRGGNWFTQKINSTVDDSGDVGAGASIAIGPDDQPSIANWYNERAATGSSQYNQLYYFKRDGNGNWSKQFVCGSSSGYQAGDGDKGAGFAPYLRFDSRGRPNIAFCDDASEHFPVWGQNEFAGDLRHAYYDGSRWVFRTVFQQAVPLDRQIVYPAMALSGSEMVFMGLERKTAWLDGGHRNANSTYNWFFVQTSTP